MYMFIEALNFHRSFWLSRSRDDIVEAFSSDLRDIFREAILANLYIPLRAGMDLLVWISTDMPELIARFRSVLRGKYGGFLGEVLSFLAVYRPSKYFPPHQDLREYVARASKDPYDYIVAYPMKKSPEWYLLPFEERRKIMAEHASQARSLSAGKKIRSYTAYSYGLDDNEFLVIYELEDLEAWNIVVEKLREAQHRRWVMREEPILTGKYISLDSLKAVLSSKAEHLEKIA
jgi:Uncharacterized conserved protein